MEAEQNALLMQNRAGGTGDKVLVDPDRSHGPIVITDEASVSINFSKKHYVPSTVMGTQHQGANLRVAWVYVVNLDDTNQSISYGLQFNQISRITTHCRAGNLVKSLVLQRRAPVLLDIDPSFELFMDQDPFEHEDPRKAYRNRAAKLTELVIEDASDNELLRCDLQSFRAHVEIRDAHLP